MNISPFSPVVQGDTYLTALQGWLNGQVFSSGIWDGVFFDNLFARINGHVPNAFAPDNLDYDWNRNGIRDETLASFSEMTRQAAINIAKGVQTANPGMQLIVGNAGDKPEVALAPYVNGYVFECFNRNWYDPTIPKPAYSPEGWRLLFDAYRTLDRNTLSPHMNVLEGCGGGADAIGVPGQHKSYLNPTALDIQTHRFSIGTALLGDGFYEYDLFDNQSAPYWFDEYSVNSSGVAVYDPAAKGYLGRALTDAMESTSPGSPIFNQTFESGLNPFASSPASRVSLSTSSADAISGASSLVIDNPDHTRNSTTSASAAIPFAAGATYLVQFDWRILQTVDLCTRLFRGAALLSPTTTRAASSPAIPQPHGSRSRSPAPKAHGGSVLLCPLAARLPLTMSR